MLNKNNVKIGDKLKVIKGHWFFNKKIEKSYK